MAAAAIAARAAMMQNQEEREEKTDEQLLEEALAEQAAKEYNKNTDPNNYTGAVKSYVEFGNFCNQFIVGKYEAYFNGFVLFCICAAGVLVGLQTYEEFDSNTVVMGMDEFILYVFTVECMVKIFAEGTNPVRFFTGPERAWNNFDFIVVILCYPFAKPLTGGNAAVLRLMRLARLVKLLKKVPQLQMIVMGLAGGLSSIIYIVILLLLVFYLYAIVGVMYFSKNDPWHFGTLHIAMLTLFRASTLEDWTDIMYINIYGCKDYPSGGGIEYCFAADPGACDNVPPMYWCADHEALGVYAAVYWITFIVISALVMLSLFVGAVTMSMSESMEDMKIEAEEQERKERLLKKQARMKEMEDKGATAKDDDHLKLDTSTMGIRDREALKNEVVMKALLLEAWEGVVMKSKVESNYADGIKGHYQWLAEKCSELAEAKWFVNLITLVIILAGVMVGLQTFPDFEDDPTLNFIDFIILLIFTFEVIIKFIAEEFAPWRFFNSGWNTFDFVVVAGSIVPTGGAGSLVTMLRLLRLLRVLKLLKSLPQLAIIVNALIMGLSSIGFIGVILLLVFYLFAIAGIYAFRENDPWHYGDLWTALLTLFRASTLEDWTDLMYINMQGCATYDGGIYVMEEDWIPENRENWCTFSMSKHWLTQIYFVFFIIVSALVMLSLFVGAVTMSMTESMEQMKEEDEAKQKAKQKAKQLKRIEEANSLRAMSTSQIGGAFGDVSTSPTAKGQSEAENPKPKKPNPSRRLTVAISEMVGLGNPQEEQLVEASRMQRLMLGAWEGVDLMSLMSDEPRKEFKNSVRQAYYDISLKFKVLVENPTFGNFITWVIIAAGVLVGAQTYDGWGEAEDEDGNVIGCQTDICRTCTTIDEIILYIFTFEILAKFIAADNTPARVLLDPWNMFDFLIVVASYALGGGMVTMLRMLRLLRVLKLVKAFPQLQVIVSALIMGMASIGYIGVILMLVFYVFAIIGIIMFKDNDPWHFGNLHIAMLSLFRASMAM
mmetsp:Transcript_31661/g.62776  ORF Transcript_31661/g.62776 Transcript_31661/m.62776 type:complete len:1001 (-) Transcript_31661:3-3005(-)